MDAPAMAPAMAPMGYVMAPLSPQPAFWPTESAPYMSSLPMPPLATPIAPSLSDLIRNQCLYYFSAENLYKDPFLRSHMDPEGWVPLRLLATFHRLRSLSADERFLQAALLRLPQ